MQARKAILAEYRDNIVKLIEDDNRWALHQSVPVGTSTFYAHAILYVKMTWYH